MILWWPATVSASGLGLNVGLMPMNVPHAVRASEASRMLLIMLREQEGADSDNSSNGT